MRTGRGMHIVAAVSLAASVAGCGGSDGPADQAVPAVPAVPGPSVVPPGDQPPLSPMTACASTGLAVALEDVQGAAGHVYGRIVLTNTGAGACTVTGYPGVSVVDAGGGQIGAAADRTGPAGTAVTLRPGGATGATLAITQAGLLPGCGEPGQRTHGAELRVYPPDNRESLLAALPGGVETCRDPAAHQLTVGAFGRP